MRAYRRKASRKTRVKPSAQKMVAERVLEFVEVHRRLQVRRTCLGPRRRAKKHRRDGRFSLTNVFEVDGTCELPFGIARLTSHQASHHRGYKTARKTKTLLYTTCTITKSLSKQPLIQRERSRAIFPKRPWPDEEGTDTAGKKNLLRNPKKRDQSTGV